MSISFPKDCNQSFDRILTGASEKFLTLLLLYPTMNMRIVKSKLFNKICRFIRIEESNNNRSNLTEWTISDLTHHPEYSIHGHWQTVVT
jgi:hypothetical protein